MNSKINAIPSLVVSLSVFLFGALSLVVPSGYSLGAIVLFMFALGYAWVRPYPKLNNADWYVIAALAAYFIVGALSNLIHRLPHNSYDNLSRFLLAIPVLLLLLRIPVKAVFYWLGVAVGALGAGVFAVWDFYASNDRADGFTNAIQFGDIAIIFSCMLLAALSWARTQSKLVLSLVISGIAGGFVASLLSESRGGWLVLPAVIAIFYWCGNYRSAKNTLLLVGVGAVLAVCIYWIPSIDFFHDRISDIFVELHGYQVDPTMNTAIGARLHMWKTSLVMIEQRPLLGWGSLSNYLAETGVRDAILADFNHVHNDFLDAWVKRGVLGAVALLTLYLLPGVAFCRALKTPLPSARAAAMAGIVLVSGAFICGLTQTFFAHSSGVMIYVFMLVILWAQTRAADQQPGVAGKSTNFYRQTGA